MPHDIAVIRELVTAALSDEELTKLCFDHFHAIYEQFAAGQTKGQRVLALVDHADRHLLLDDLLARVKAANPRKYAEFAPYDTDIPPDVLGRDKRNKLKLLDRVYSFWIEGFLYPKLRGLAPIELDKKLSRDAVENPWHGVLQPPQFPEAPVSTDLSVDELFEQMGCSLLILGEPGSGKTIALLELANAAIARAKTDPVHQPIPVVFLLSSWDPSYPTLDDWLVQELSTKYLIPKELGRRWIEKDELLLLLDGLDEMRAELQEACIQAINRLREEHGLTGMVVCSRSEAYLHLSVKLKLQGAIHLQPLTSEKIDEYLASLGTRYAVLHHALQHDADLQTLLWSPLMLSIAGSLFSQPMGQPTNIRDQSSLETRRKRLFDDYVQQALDRKATNQLYSPEKTKPWLAWLARQMTKTSQSLFLMENLQPGWLSNGRERWFYVLSVTLIAAIPIGLLMGLGTWLPGVLGGVQSLGINVGLAACVAVALVVGRVGFPIGALICGLIFGLAFGVPFNRFYGWRTGLTLGGFVASAAGMAFALASVQLTRRSKVHRYDIQIVERLTWSWPAAARGLLFGFIPGFGFGRVIWWAIRGDFLVPGFGVPFALVFGATAGLILAVVIGFSSHEIGMTVTPNEGIRRSAQNAIRVGFAVSTAVGIPVGLVSGFAWQLDA